MKHVLTKVLCILTSVVMCLPLFAAGVMAETPATYVMNADEMEVSGTHTAIENLPGYMSITPAQKGDGITQAKIYKLTDSLGLTDGNDVLQFVQKEERKDKQKFIMKNVAFEATGDFYLTTDVYVGDSRSNDYLGFYGSYKGYHINKSDITATEKSDISSLFYFTGDGRISSNFTNYWASYVPNNWYRFTLAFSKQATGDKYDVTAYLDNIDITSFYKNNAATKANAIMKGISDASVVINEFGISGNYPGTVTDFTGIPQWYAVEHMQLYSGTYNSGSANTTITSDNYTVNSTSFDTTTVAGSIERTSVKGVADNTSVIDFISNITLPAGATAKVVKIADDTKATTVIGGNEIVTSDMQLLVTTSDETKKLYDISVDVATDKLPQISANASYPGYTIDAVTKTVTIPDTTVEKLRSRITVGEGTSVKVVDANGFAVASSEPVNSTMKLVASKNGYSDEYAITIQNLEFFGDLSASGTVLYTEEYKDSKWSVTEGRAKIPPYGGGSGTTYGQGSYAYDENGNSVTAVEGSKYVLESAAMPVSGVPSYKSTFTKYDGWVTHVSHSSSTHCESDEQMEKNYDKFIVNYDICLEEGAAAHLTFDKCIVYSGTNGKDGRGFGDNLSLANGKIYFGAGLNKNNGITGGVEIGSYTANQPIEITMVQKAPDGISSNVTVEAIYINDTKVFPRNDTEGNLTTNNNDVARKFHALYFWSHGTVYWGKINVYKADNYAPDAATPEEAEMSITAASGSGLKIDTVNNYIYGWENTTVAELKENIVSANGIQKDVLNRIGSAELAETANTELGMLFKITDKNYPENTAIYTLVKGTEDGGTVINVSDNTIKAAREILVYTPDAQLTNIKKTLILATYEGSLLKEVKIDEHTFSGKIEDADFSVEIEGFDNTKHTYKAFFWNMDSLVPYEGVTEAK